MSSTLAAAKPISAKVSSAASSSRSTVSSRRRRGRTSFCSPTDKMQHCIRYIRASSAPPRRLRGVYGHNRPCGRRRQGSADVGQALRVSSYRRLLPGVFIASHAIAEGVLTRKQLRHRGYRRLVHGVYADPSLPLDHRLRCRGVALLLPPGTAIGGHSAAAWYGAPFAAARSPVTVVRPPHVEWKGPRGVRVHCSRSRLDVVRDPDDVPVTTALRTAWDTAALESLGTAVAALDAMVRTTAVRAEELSAMASAGARQWGIAKVRRAFELVDARAESPPESRVRVALVLAGLSPV